MTDTSNGWVYVDAKNSINITVCLYIIKSMVIGSFLIILFLCGFLVCNFIRLEDLSGVIHMVIVYRDIIYDLCMVILIVIRTIWVFIDIGDVFHVFDFG